ncbi:hypothetical protein FRB98_007395 [Tulasnella sp. 332]|nr:hypothetical protein FRB98_007395 [Tulasnella sp. 332]
MAAVVIASVISGLALVLTRKIWENWNIMHMDPKLLPLPVNLQPDPRQATIDQIAVANALKRITLAAQGREGTNLKDLPLSSEDHATLNSLTPQQKEALIYVLKASAQVDGPKAAAAVDIQDTHSATTPAARPITTPQVTLSSGSRLQKRVGYFQAGISGVLGGIAFAITGISVQQWLNYRFGPKSSLRRRDGVTLSTVESSGCSSEPADLITGLDGTRQTGDQDQRKDSSSTSQHSPCKYALKRRTTIPASVISVGRDTFASLLAGGAFTYTMFEVVNKTGGNPFSRTWNYPVLAALPVKTTSPLNTPKTIPPNSSTNTPIIIPLPKSGGVVGSQSSDGEADKSQPTNPHGNQRPGSSLPVRMSSEATTETRIEQSPAIAPVVGAPANAGTPTTEDSKTVGVGFSTVPWNRGVSKSIIDTASTGGDSETAVVSRPSR